MRLMTTLLGVCLAGAVAAQANDSVDLANGGKLVGEVAGLKPGKIVFDDKDLGKVDLTLDQIKSVNSSKSLDVWYQSSRHHGQEQGKVTFAGGKPSFNGGDFATGDLYRID
ncbi:MAG: hypothetical protein KDB07_09620, partial [Planctomycetes bacterium]|nr:hypothetical protein [Planctomycetota bacterium]